MYRTFCFCFIIFNVHIVFAQKDSIESFFTFRITDYMIRLDDSTTIVQIAVPDAWPLKIADEQIGILKHRYEQGVEYDTNMIGWGRCHLIKEEWHYFAIHQYQQRKPAQGDLLVTGCQLLPVYTGLLFNLARHGISLTRVDGDQFYNSAEVFYMGPKSEQKFLDSMAVDIRYTGKAMLAQNNGRDQLIVGGLFDGKKLFAAMQTITRNEVERFLEYMAVYPVKYAGNVWKLSEIFATWMTNQTRRIPESNAGQN